MATDESNEAPPEYDRLFASATLDDLVDGLTWQQFERFVGHVFECAGYQVEHVGHQHFPHGPGVDLNLYNSPARVRPLARVEVRHYARNNLIALNDVARFDGFLNQIQNRGVPGFLVTTSSFVPNAWTFAEGAKLTTLVDGPMLIRYIRYIGGSRVNGEYADVPISPPYPTELGYLYEADSKMKSTMHPPRHTRIITVANGKGGVAKTTSALNMAFALADRHKQRVLLVDMDGQASASQTLPRPLPPGAPRGTETPVDTLFITDYFRSLSSLGGLVRPTRIENLWLVPATFQLQQMDSGGGARPQAELRFLGDMRTLEALDEHSKPLPPFDWIIIDTPPAQSFYARVAVAASDFVIIPACAEQFAVRGLNGVLRTVETMCALTGVSHWQQKILGCFVARWRASANANASLATLVSELDAKGITRFEHNIPYDDRVEQAHRGVAGGGWRTIFRLANALGPAARAYDEVTEEVLTYVHRHEANLNSH